MRPASSLSLELWAFMEEVNVQNVVRSDVFVSCVIFSSLALFMCMYVKMIRLLLVCFRLYVVVHLIHSVYTQYVACESCFVLVTWCFYWPHLLVHIRINAVFPSNINLKVFWSLRDGLFLLELNDHHVASILSLYLSVKLCVHLSI